MSAAPSKVLVDVTVPARADQLAELRRRVGEAADAVHCGAELRSRLLLVVNEAFANVVRHGYGLDDPSDVPDESGAHDVDTAQASQKVRVLIEQVGDDLTFSLRDWAPAINASEIKPRDLSECRPGGLGINIIDEVMDHWRFVKPADGHGNLLIMKKRIE